MIGHNGRSLLTGISYPCWHQLEVAPGQRRPEGKALEWGRMREEIFEAAHLNDTQRLRGLLDADPELIEKRSDDFGRTPLHCACRRGSLEAAELLLDRGADLNCRDREGKSALELTRDERLLNLLRARGAR